LSFLLKTGMTPQHAAILVDTIAVAREAAVDPGKIMQLVLSGPEVPGVATSDTAATMRTLIAEAAQEILLVGYAVHHVGDLFEPLATKMASNESLKVLFCLDISRRLGDTSLDSEIVRRFCRDFREKHWPWPNVPRLYYDPRALSENFERHSSLHAKCVVADRNVALITSANFTQAAQQRNIEVGVLIRYIPLIERLCVYFQGLIANGQLVECPL
jgi:phosphatidylserine/phosphatidylglycerophosphate/cardiolipin synthase-like enzyme